MVDDAAPAATTAGMRILICEDEGLTALRLQRVLRTLGFQIAGEAKNGEEAVRLALQLRPDVILMDVNMPKLDGIRATQRIMQECPTAVVMLTAYSEPELVQRALEAGASAYLVKPVVDEQLSPAIEVARARFAELRQERATAISLAASFVGPTPAIPGFQVASHYEPAAEAARVGGDYYDFIDLGDQQVGIVIGDVCGNGIPAATYTTMARHMLRAYCLEDPAPARVLDRLNRALYQQMGAECQFITLIYGVLDLPARCFTYGSAGHPPPVLYTSNRELCRVLPTTGGVLGVMPEMVYEEERVTLPAGAVLALVTDGVTEAHVGERMLESSGVAEVLQEHAAEPAQSIVAAILERAHEFAGGFLHDDVAIIVLKNEADAH